ncbi:Nucleic acid-binding, OB-fold [Sesbania bispinosa]|nr:Nucleic acid-binding, OB-fold [Sesbania bispinosa]
MANLNSPFVSLKDIVNERSEALRLKVRVVRVWEICQRNNPSNVFSVEMVLVDAEGGRIQASIRKAMIRKFKSSTVEGGVYKMIYFSLVENGGEYRACSHQFKFLFQPRTRIFPTESEVIPRFGIQAKDFEELQQTNGVSHYMFDFIGLLTAVGEEREFMKFGRPIRVLEIELTDDKAVMKCSLFGHFIEMMKNFLANGVDDLGILVIQFAKVKEYLGQVSLHTVDNSTRLLWNPQISEVISFKDRLKLEVRDHSETAHFVLFDFDVASLLSMSCASIVGDAKVPTLHYPPELDMLIGKELLFKVEVKAERAFKFDDSFKMKLKGPVNEVFNVEDDQPGDESTPPEIAPLIEQYNEAEMSPLSLGESSGAAACLAPQKRKAGPRPGRGGPAKKSLHPKVLKVEKN